VRLERFGRKRKIGTKEMFTLPTNISNILSGCLLEFILDGDWDAYFPSYDRAAGAVGILLVDPLPLYP